MLRRTRLSRGTTPLKSNARLKNNKTKDWIILSQKSPWQKAKKSSGWKKKSTEEACEKKQKRSQPIGVALANRGRIKSQAVIDACRRPTCEVCGRPVGGEPHHIISRGAGGPDIPENLIQLCKTCHIHAHNGQLKKEKILWTIASRFHTTPTKILEKIEAARPRS